MKNWNSFLSFFRNRSALSVGFILTGIAMSIVSIYAEVEVYPAPNFRMLSGKYRVTVVQDETPLSSFVYESTNPFGEVHQPISDANHWTTFSFEGTVTVEVEVLGKDDLGEVNVLPASADISCEVEANVVRFELTKPEKIHLEVEEFELQPMFVFAHAIECEKPDLTADHVIDLSKNPKILNDPDRANLIYFPPGEYDLVEMGYDMNRGFPLDEGDTVYLAGGAMVQGAFSSYADNVSVIGRGMMNSDKYMWVRRRYHEADIPWDYGKYREVAVYLAGENSRVEGITFTDPVHFCIHVGDQSVVRDVQCFGWWYTTDGVRAGVNSLVEDCFFKVNDDNIKLYYSGMQVRNCRFWQQNNGAPFQLSWNLRHPVEDILVEDCVIFKCDVSNDREWASNRAIVTCRENYGADFRNLLFKNIRVECDIWRLVALRMGDAGTIDGITLKDWVMDGEIAQPSTFSAEVGSIRNIRFEGIQTPQGTLSAESHPIRKRGDVEALIFAE